jgi:hypothetical protein
MDLTRRIFRRYHEYDAGREPVISLSEFQRERIQKVLERIENGYYILENPPVSVERLITVSSSQREIAMDSRWNPGYAKDAGSSEHPRDLHPRAL